MFERVWADMKGNWAVKAAVAKEAGVPAGNFNKTEFEAFIQKDDQCPELAHCKLITNASKHVGADWVDGDPVFVIDASLSASGTPSNTLNSGDLDWLPIYDEGGKAPWVFKIVKGEALDGKDRTNAADLIHKVRDYWANFIDHHGIGSV